MPSRYKPVLPNVWSDGPGCCHCGGPHRRRLLQRTAERPQEGDRLPDRGGVLPGERLIFDLRAYAEVTVKSGVARRLRARGACCASRRPAALQRVSLRPSQSQSASPGIRQPRPAIRSAISNPSETAADFDLHAGNHLEPGEEIRNRACFQKSGSKVCAGSVGFEIALPTLPYGAVSTPRPSMAPLLPTESQPSFANSVRSTFAFVWSLSLGSRVL